MQSKIMSENLDRRILGKKYRVSILEQAKSKLVLKQQNFRGGISNLNSSRRCNTESQEFCMFALPNDNDKTSRTIDPTGFFKEQLGLTINDSLCVVEGIKKKELSCQIRKDYIDLANWMRNCLSGLKNIAEQNEMPQQSIFEYLQKIYNSCMSEIIQKTRIESTQKGALLEIVWQNIMELTLWLNKYYQKRIAKQTKKYITKCDEDSRRYLFKINDIQQKMHQVSQTKNKQQKYFIQVVKDNRILRRRNRKLIQRLSYELDSNKYLKEQNIKFFKQNQKMKLVINQQDQTAQLKVLFKKFRELESKLLSKSRVTGNSILRQIKAKELEQKFQEQIKIIVRRINEQDLLDLDYYEPPKVSDLKTTFANCSVQTQPDVQHRGTNTYLIIDIKKQSSSQTEAKLQLDSMVLQLKISEKLNTNLRSRQKSCIAPSAKRTSRISGEIAPIKALHNVKSALGDSLTVRKPDDVPRTFEQSVDKIANFYENLTKIVDSLRMALVAVPTHQKSRVKRQTRVFASKAFEQIKKLFANSNLIPFERPTLQRVSKPRTSDKDLKFKKVRPSHTNSQVKLAQELIRISENHSSESNSDNQDQHSIFGQKSQKKFYPNTFSNQRKSVLKSQRSSMLKSQETNSKSSAKRSSQSLQSFIDFIAPMNSLQPTNKHRKSRNKSINIEDGYDTILQFQQYDQKVQTARRKTPPKIISRPQHEQFPQKQVNISNIEWEPEKQRKLSKATAIPRHSNLFKQYQLSRFQTEVEAKPDRRISIKKHLITSNFQTREQLIKFFEAAIRQPVSQKVPQQSKKESDTTRDTQQMKKSQSIGIAQKCGYVKQNIKIDLSDDGIPSTLETGEESPIFISILGRIEQALNNKDKQLKQQITDMKNKGAYSRNMLRKLFLFLVREINKHKNKIFKKQYDFESFFQQWMLYRYGLDQICHEIVNKVKASLDLYYLESPEFRSLKILFKTKQNQKKYFSKGLFRIFALFVEFGAQKTSLLKEDNSTSNTSFTDAIQFVKSVLSVYLGPNEIAEFMKALKQKYCCASDDVQNSKVTMNIFDLFLDVQNILRVQSQNPQLSLLLKSLTQFLSFSSNEQISLQNLFIIWAIIEPNQSKLQKNILTLVKFCSIGLEHQRQRLIIPIYKLTLLAKRFSWRSLLFPVDIINDRYQQMFGQACLREIVQQWEKQRQLLKSNLVQYPQIIELLDNKILRYKIRSSMKQKTQPFPLLLYRTSKLAVANDLFTKHLQEIFDDRLEMLEFSVAKYERKMALVEISK